MTFAGWIVRARALCLALSSAAFAALCGRAMLDSIDAAAAERVAATQPAEEQPALLQLADELVGAEPRAASTPGAPTSEASGEGAMRVTLSVTAGPPRSDVFVNGWHLGDSPYLGDYACKRGEALRIEIVPERGPLVVRHAHCLGRNLFIRE